MKVRFVISMEVEERVNSESRKDEKTQQQAVPASKDLIREHLPSLVRQWVLPWFVS